MAGTEGGSSDGVRGYLRTTVDQGEELRHAERMKPPFGEILRTLSERRLTNAGLIARFRRFRGRFSSPKK